MDRGLEFDLGCLAAFDSQTPALKSEKALLKYTQENVQLLVDQLYTTLPLEEGDMGLIATLPPRKTKLPREKPVPMPKPLTKWEKFALEKGIRKRDKSKQVWDESAGEFRRAYGYKRANDQSADPTNWVVEHRDGMDAANPFSGDMQAKKQRVLKQRKQEMRTKEIA